MRKNPFAYGELVSVSGRFRYMYIYILFGPVKPELGVIPSGQKKKKFNREHLNFPCKELNITDITEQ